MKPLLKPKEEIEKTKTAIEEMKKSQNLKELEDAWKKCLGHIERIWNKSCSHLKRSPKFQGWTERGRTERLRRSDPLLSYLRNARGAEEHTIEDIVKHESGGIGINPAEGKSLHIKRMELNKDNIKIESEQKLKIEFIPGKMKLIPVTNRGVKYDVPANHLGQDIEDSSPVHLAELGLAFYEDYIDKAEKFFVK